MPSLAKRRKQDDCVTAYKALNNLPPKYISELVNKRINSKNLRGINKLNVPRVFTTTYGLNSFRYGDAPFDLEQFNERNTLCIKPQYLY